MTDKAAMLFEIGTEELPPRALKQLHDALIEGFQQALDAQNLAHGQITGYATPRRLAVKIDALQLQQADKKTERRGPALKAAFDGEGQPSKAAEGFARSCGTTVDQLKRLKTVKGEWLSFTHYEKGQSAAELLPTIAKKVLNELPIPKRMRWGTSKAEFVRPVHWLLFIHGDQVINCKLLDQQADNKTRGHRFHAPDVIKITDSNDYEPALKNARVIADFNQRRELIRQQVKNTAESIGGQSEFDDDLLDEVTALTEWPVPILGSFDAHFLEVPHEALILSMKKNQKYFHILDAKGALLPNFITIANIKSTDPDVIRQGNERVIRPRLADARFFWKQDAKKTLEQRLKALKTIVFQHKLGSLYEKSVRVSAIGKHIAEQISADSNLTERAAMFSRCDLVTEMVFEFADMQGIMGRYQARRDGESEELAIALDEFYMPRFSGDQLPQTPTGTAIALADRIDTLVGIFGIHQKPTGEKDPFGLRRASIGILRILKEKHLDLGLKALLQQATDLLEDRLDNANTITDVYQYMLERLRGIYADEGFSADLFNAVSKVQPQSIADFDARIRAVAAFRKRPEAESLAMANKRIRNLLKKNSGDVPDKIDLSLLSEDAEHQLVNVLKAVEKEVEPMLKQRDYGAVLTRLAVLHEALNSYFDDVMVMVDDKQIKINRIATLSRLASLFLEVADISQLQQ